MPTTCPYCRETIAEADGMHCPACHAPHHQDCWNENGGCTVFGCSSAPPDEPKLTLESTAVPPVIPPPPYTGGRGTPILSGVRSGTNQLVGVFLQHRRKLLQNMLLVGLIAIPVGGLAGALIGAVLGFVCAIFGAGAGAIVSFPMSGVCFGQAFAVCAGMVAVAILGEGFLAPLRRWVAAAAAFIFTDLRPAPPIGEKDASEHPPS